MTVTAGTHQICLVNHKDKITALDNHYPQTKKEIASRWSHWRKEKNRRAKDETKKGINSAAIFSVLSKYAPDDAVICVDVGNNTYSFGRYFECKNQSILMSGYLGSIGFADYANLCGGMGIKITKLNELDSGIKKGLESKKASIVEIITDPLLI